MGAMSNKHHKRETGEAILTKYGASREELQQQQKKGRLTDPELLDALELLEEEPNADEDPTSPVPG